MGANTWAGDGTFKCVPTPFAQLYVICAQVGETSLLPVCFCLTPNQEQTTYETIFFLLKELCDSEPRQIILDFELASHNAVNHIYPSCLIIGCLFHFKQAILRQVRKKGLQESYTHDEQFKGILNKMFALVYVPVEHLTAVWESVLLQDINLWNEEASSVEKDAMSNFSTYFLETYLGRRVIKRKFSNPRFRHETWNKANLVGMRRAVLTNNSLEGWNAKWNSCGSNASNIWRSIERFREESCFTKNRAREIEQALRQNPQAVRSYRIENKYRSIRKLVDQFDLSTAEDYFLAMERYV